MKFTKERARNIMMLGHQFHNLALLFNFMMIQNNKRLCSKWFSYQILRNTTFDLNKCEIFCQNTTLSTSLCSVDASSNVTAVSLKEGRKVCAAFEGGAIQTVFEWKPEIYFPKTPHCRLSCDAFPKLPWALKDFEL